MFPIHCEENDMAAITTAFPGRCCQFPCRYLGLPLCIGRTRRADEQLLIDKIGARLPGWKGRLLSKAGRLTLVNAVLSSIPTYHLTVFPLSKWAVKRIDRLPQFSLARSRISTRGSLQSHLEAGLPTKEFGRSQYPRSCMLLQSTQTLLALVPMDRLG